MARLMVVIALFLVTTMPASAGVPPGVFIRTKLDGGVDVTVPDFGTLTKISPAGTQIIPITQSLVVTDLNPGRWACYVFTRRPIDHYPGVCIFPNTHTPGGPHPITFLASDLYNQAILGWQTTPPGADSFIGFGTNHHLVPIIDDTTFRVPITVFECYVVLAMHQGQVQGRSDIACIIPNPGQETGAVRDNAQTAPASRQRGH